MEAGLQTAAERDALASFVQRVRGLPREAAAAVLAELDPEFVQDLLAELARESGRAADVMKIARARERDWAPTTDEELYDFIVGTQGLRIPRRAVCEGHRAPFELAADVYFERGNPDKAAIGNRGSGKSQIMGSVHAANVRTKRLHEGLTVGAIENQAKRVYSFFRHIVTQPDWRQFVDPRKVKIGSTEGASGSSVSIVTGTISGVNSPHPNLSHIDELELLRPGVYDEAMNMSQSKNGHRGMNVLTSSWKKPTGPVSAIMQEAEASARDGNVPEYEIYRWCVWETTAPCEADCDACPFANVIKGTRKERGADGEEVEVPRTFEWACKRGSPAEGVGKLKFTDGFIAVEDTVRRFRRLPRRVWESQQESRRPSLEGLVYGEWDEELYAVDFWVPDPAYGPVTVGLDFGGSVPHAATFWQQMKAEVLHHRSDGAAIRVPVGADVCFDQVYEADISSTTFGERVMERVAHWQQAFPDFEVEAYYGDPAAADARMNFAAATGHVVKHRKSGVDDGIALVEERMSSPGVFIDRMRCEDVMNEQGGYEWKRPGVPVKEDDHAMDSMRYRFVNVHGRRLRQDDASDGVRTKARLRAIQGGRDRSQRWDPEKLGQAAERTDSALERVLAPAVGFMGSKNRRLRGSDPF